MARPRQLCVGKDKAGVEPAARELAPVAPQPQVVRLLLIGTPLPSSAQIGEARQAFQLPPWNSGCESGEKEEFLVLPSQRRLPGDTVLPLSMAIL